MLITIQEVSQEFTKSGAEYRKVKGITEKNQESTKNVFDNLQEKWDKLIEGATLEFKMEKKGQFWNVVDILDVNLPPPQDDKKVLQEHQEAIDKAVPEEQPPLAPPAPQAVGMATKEIGDMIRSKYLVSMFGGKIARGLMRWYQHQMLGITRIEFDGNDLPKFEE